MTLVFNPAAFKHKVSERDIESAMATAIFDEIIEGYNNKYLLIGNELLRKLRERGYYADFN